MPAHHIRHRRVGAGRVVRVGAAASALLGLPDEAVHLAAVNVCRGVGLPVWTAAIHVIGVVIGLVTGAGFGIRHADGGDAILHGNAVGAGIGAKIRVEGTVLLHDDNDMLDLIGRD